MKKASSVKNRTLGVGIVGTGWVAGAHADTFGQLPGCEVVAMSSRRRSRAKERLAELDLPDAVPCEGIDELLAVDGVDIVVICTPHPSHPAETIAAAKAGKHVVIEKPVALDRQNLRKMLAVVDKTGVLTSVCFELHWLGLFQNIQAVMRQGLIGEPFYGEANYWHGIGPWYPQYPWNRKKAMGGDALLTAGCHALDGLIHLMGSRVQSVQAVANTSRRNPLKFEYEPNVVALLTFEDGKIGKVATSVECRQPYLFPILIQGDKGSIWNDKIHCIDWPGLDRNDWATIPTAMPDSGDVADHPYLGQHTEFVDCIRKGKRPSNDLAACAHVHEVMFAIQKAIDSGKREKVLRCPGER